MSCQQYKPLQQKPASEMLRVIHEEPLTTICLEFIEPLTRIKSGHTMLLIFIDQLSKSVNVVSLWYAREGELLNAFSAKIRNAQANYYR